MTTWAIKDWATLFQKGDLRPGRVMTWAYVPIPIRLNGEGYKRLARTPKGREAFMVFIALCELAANLTTRGVLADERGPLSTESISIKISVPERVVEAAIGLLSSEQIRWLVPWDESAKPRSESAEPRENGALPLPHPSGAIGEAPQPHRNGTLPAAAAAAGPEPGGDKDAAIAALTAEPWPGMSPVKAEALAARVSPGAVLAAIQRGKAKNARGENVGAGLVATWIADGSAEKWAEQDRVRRRRGVRANWDRTPDEDKARWLGRYFDAVPDAKCLDHAMVAASDRFMDWLGVAASKRS